MRQLIHKITASLSLVGLTFTLVACGNAVNSTSSLSSEQRTNSVAPGQAVVDSSPADPAATTVEGGKPAPVTSVSSPATPVAGEPLVVDAHAYDCNNEYGNTCHYCLYEYVDRTPGSVTFNQLIQGSFLTQDRSYPDFYPNCRQVAVEMSARNENQPVTIWFVPGGDIRARFGVANLMSFVTDIARGVSVVKPNYAPREVVRSR